MTDLKINMQRLQQDINDLAQIGRDADRGLHR